MNTPPTYQVDLCPPERPPAGKVDLSPPTGLISALRAQHKLQWPQFVGELIDNAVDAGAQRVTLDFSVPDQFRAIDDGRGCDDLRCMLAPGERRDHSTTGTGRYGIGAKDAMICLGHMVTIRSVCAGVVRSVSVNWPHIEASGSWVIDAPAQMPTSDPPGTAITISRLQRKIPGSSPSCFRDLVQRLGMLYAPAIVGGRLQINLRYGKGGRHLETVGAIPQPALEREESADFSFPHGKSARVRMGIIVEPNERLLQGVTVAIPNRVVRPRSRIGLGTEPTPGLYGYAELSRGWSLAKNKDDLSPHDQELLGGAIADRFSGLIGYARKAGEDVLLAGCNKIMGLLPTAIRRDRDRARKARRAPPTHHTGTVIPTGRGGPHTQAVRTQPGERFRGEASSDGGSFHLVRQDLGSSALMSLGDGMIVSINRDHPFYKHVSGDMAVLGPLAVLFVASQLQLKGQKMIPFDDFVGDDLERHAKTVSYMLDRYVEAARIAAESSSAAS